MTTIDWNAVDNVATHFAVRRPRESCRDDDQRVQLFSRWLRLTYGVDVRQCDGGEYLNHYSGKVVNHEKYVWLILRWA